MNRSTGWLRDDAESLVELLVAISILGVTIVAIIEVLFTMVSGSLAHTDDVKGQNVLGVWAESVSNSTYAACASTAAVAAAAPAPTPLPTGYTAAVQSVTYWNGSSFGSSCVPATDTGLELITLSVTPAPGPIPVTAQTLQVVKRKPCGSGC